MSLSGDRKLWRQTGSDLRCAMVLLLAVSVHRWRRKIRFDWFQNGLNGSAAMIWDRGVRRRSRWAAASSATLL
jgi:hypothetical protein